MRASDQRHQGMQTIEKAGHDAEPGALAEVTVVGRPGGRDLAVLVLLWLLRWPRFPL